MSSYLLHTGVDKGDNFLRFDIPPFLYSNILVHRGTGFRVCII